VQSTSTAAGICCWNSVTAEQGLERAAGAHRVLSEDRVHRARRGRRGRGALGAGRRRLGGRVGAAPGSDGWRLTKRGEPLEERGGVNYKYEGRHRPKAQAEQKETPRLYQCPGDAA
jgi:hypothetical protein